MLDWECHPGQGELPICGPADRGMALLHNDNAMGVREGQIMILKPFDHSFGSLPHSRRKRW
jgi:hypothetical protein